MNKSTIRQNKSAILHEASRDKHRVMSSSRSPVKIVNGIKLFNFSDIDSYRLINKPYLNNQKSQMIKTKLDLQKSAMLITNQRIKKGNSFVKYNLNPFLQNKIIEKIVKDQDEFQPQIKNLVHELNDMKNKKIDRTKHFAALNNKKDQANKFSDFIRKKQSILKKHTKSMIDLPKTKEVTSSDQFVKRQKQFELSLDTIVKIEQQNVFKEQYKSMNIFRVLFHKEQFFKDKKPLNRYKFCFNSMIEKNIYTKLPIYRDLSHQARGCVGKRPTKMPENNDEFSKANIKFEDLINVSAGRYTPQYIQQRLNALDRFKSQQFRQVLEEDDQELIKLSKMTVTETKHQQLRQIKQFKDLQLSPVEKIYEKLCQRRKEQISANLNKEQHLVNSLIYDKAIHKQLKKEVQRDQRSFVESDFKYPKAIPDRNRHVRQTKDAKNRMQIVKMKKLLQTYFLKNKNDQLISRLISSRK